MLQHYAGICTAIWQYMWCRTVWWRCQKLKWGIRLFFILWCWWCWSRSFRHFSFKYMILSVLKKCQHTDTIYNIISNFISISTCISKVTQMIIVVFDLGNGCSCDGKIPNVASSPLRLSVGFACCRVQRTNASQSQHIRKCVDVSPLPS